MMAGTIIGERVETKKDGVVTGHRWKTYVVKSVTATGVVTLLRADASSSSMEAKTNKGFAERVKSGKFADWRVLNTAGVDAAVTASIAEQEERDRLASDTASDTEPEE